MSASKTKKKPGQPRLPKPEPEPEAGRDDRDRDVMTLHQVAEYLDCSYATVLLRVMRDGLLVFRLGGAGNGWRVRRSALEKWIAERQAEPYALVKHRNRGRKPKSDSLPARGKGKTRPRGSAE